jgi:putative oxidoreductase
MVFHSFVADPLMVYAGFGLLALRLAIGSIFVYHGIPKLKMGKQMAQGIFGSEKKGWFVNLVGANEVFSGLAIILGLLTNIAALLLIPVMLGALYLKIKVWKVPFFAMDKTGWEFDMINLATLVALAVLGGGAYSLDAVL